MAQIIISKDMVMPSVTTTSVKKAKKLGLKPVVSTGKPKYFIGWDRAVDKLFEANAVDTQAGPRIVTPTGKKLDLTTFKKRMDLIRDGERVSNELQFKQIAKRVAYSNLFVNTTAPTAKIARFEQFDAYDMFGYSRTIKHPKTGKKVLLADYFKSQLRDEKGRFAIYDARKAKPIATGSTASGRTYTIYRYYMTPNRFIEWRRYNSTEEIRMTWKNGSIVQTE